jgi:hypothetical protein
MITKNMELVLFGISILEEVIPQKSGRKEVINFKMFNSVKCDKNLKEKKYQQWQRYKTAVFVYENID